MPCTIIERQKKHFTINDNSDLYFSGKIFYQINIMTYEINQSYIKYFYKLTIVWYSSKNATARSPTLHSHFPSNSFTVLIMFRAAHNTLSHRCFFKFEEEMCSLKCLPINRGGGSISDGRTPKTTCLLEWYFSTILSTRNILFSRLDFFTSFFLEQHKRIPYSHIY